MDFDLNRIISDLQNAHDQFNRYMKKNGFNINQLEEDNEDLRDEIRGYESRIEELEEQLDHRGAYADQYDVIHKLYDDKISLSPSQFEYELDQFFRKILNKRVK